METAPTSGDVEGWPGRPQRNDYRVDLVICDVNVSHSVDHDRAKAGCQFDPIAAFACLVSDGRLSIFFRRLELLDYAYGVICCGLQVNSLLRRVSEVSSEPRGKQGDGL